MSSTTAKRQTLIASASRARGSAAGATTAIQLDAAGFMRDLAAHLAKLEVDTEDDLTRVGLRVQSAARSLCPVDTGRLRSSIVMKRGRDGQGFYVQVGTNVHYAPYVEFGTSRMAARPFLLPAVAQATGFLRQEAAS